MGVLVECRAGEVIGTLGMRATGVQTRPLTRAATSGGALERGAWSEGVFSGGPMRCVGEQPMRAGRSWSVEDR